MYTEAKSNLVRENLRAYLDHVSATGDRVLITRHGAEIAALVSVRDFEALEKAGNTTEAFLRARQQQELREYRMIRGGMED